MANKKISYVIDIDGDLSGISSKLQQLSKELSSTFMTKTNIGQSLGADFREVEKVVSRIRDAASKPIRNEWGMETLISDTESARKHIEQIIEKLKEVRDYGDKKTRLKLIDESQLNAFNALTKKEKEQKKNLEGLINLQKEYNDTVARLADARAAVKGKTLIGESVLNKQRMNIDSLVNDLNKLPRGFKTITGKDSSKVLEIDYEKKIKQIEGWKQSQEEKALKASTTESEKKTAQEIAKAYSDEINILKKLNVEVKKYNQYIEKNAELAAARETRDAYAKDLDSLKKTMSSAIIDESGQITDFNIQGEEAQKLADILANLGIQIDATNLKYSDLTSAIIQTDAEFDKESRETLNETIDEYEKLRKALNDTANAEVDLKEKTDETNRTQNEVNALKNRIAMFTGLYGAFNLLRRAASHAMQTIKELDEQMTQMAVVTTSTITDYWKQLPEYTERANKFGAAIKDVYAADTLYYQQGLKTNQVIQVSNETLKLARIAALDTAEATDRLTAAMRGFSMVVGQESAERVNDVFSKLAAITASNVEEISKAMTKTASIAHSAGMEFETTAAFLSQIIETTRESAETAGTAMKTVIARFGELKKSPSQIGEIEGEIVDANKIETALRSVGISLRDAQGQFRDLDKVFLELSEKWGTLDKNTQRYIATIAAGSRQQSRFIAMMQNYSRTMELVTAANNSAGTSSEQFAKTMDSLKNKLNGLKNAWDTFTMGILRSDVFKFLIDVGTSIVNGINRIFELVDKLDNPILSAISRIGMLILALKGVGKVFDVVLDKAIPWAKAQINHIKGIKTETVALEENTAAQAANAAAAEKNNATRVGSIFSKEAASGFLQKMKSAAPVIGKIAIAIGAIAAIVKLIQVNVNTMKYNSQEEKYKRDKEALEAYNKAIDDAKDKIENLNTAQSNYDSLVDKLKELTIGTSDWRTQLAKVNNEVIKLVSEYKELAPYISKDSTTGQLSISDEGWKALNTKQQQELINWQRVQIAQQRKVYQNQQAQNQSNFIGTYGDLGEYLSSLNSEALQAALLDEGFITQLSSDFDESTATIRGAIQELVQNRTAIETNNAQLAVLSQQFEDEAAPQIGIEAEVEKRVRDTWEKAYAEFDSKSTYEGTKLFTEMLAFYGKELKDIEDRGDKQLLAGLKGLTQGKTWEQGVSDYSDLTGYWSGTRGVFAEELVQDYLRQKYTKELSGDSDALAQIGKNFGKNEKLFLEGNISQIPIDEIKNLTLDTDTLELATKQGLIDERALKNAKYSDYFDNQYLALDKNKDIAQLTAEQVLDDYAGWLETNVSNDKIADAFKKAQEFFEVIPELDAEELQRIYQEKLFGGYLNTQYTSPTSPYSAINYTDLVRGSVADLTGESIQKLLERIDRMFQRNGGARGALTQYDELYSSLTSGMTQEAKQTFSDILGLYDWTNTADLEKMGTQLKKETDLTDGQIKNLIDTLSQLNKAVEKVDLTNLISGLNAFAATVEQLRLGTFEGTVTADMYKQMTTVFGFKPEEFIKNTAGNYVYNGSNTDLMDRLIKTLSPNGQYSRLVNFADSRKDIFGDVEKREDITETTLQLFRDSIADIDEGILKATGLETVKEGDTQEALRAIRDFWTNWVDTLEDNKNLIEHADELLAQALGTEQENANKLLTGGYAGNEGYARGLIAQLQQSGAISESDLNLLKNYNTIMEAGGQEAQLYEKRWKALVTELANTAGIARATENMKTSAGKISSALQSIGDSAVETEAEINEIQQVIAHFGIRNLGHGEDARAFAEQFQSLFLAIQEGNEEAFNLLINLSGASMGGVTDAINVLAEEGSLVNQQLMNLAHMFESFGFGHINAENMSFHFFNAKDFAEEMNGSGKDKKEEPWVNPYDWLWNITEQINKQIYLRERLERKYAIAVKNSADSAERLLEISQDQLVNLEQQAKLEKIKGEKARQEASMLMAQYQEYAKFISLNPLTGQVQVDYEALNNQGWDSTKGSAFESFVSRITELSGEIKDSVTILEEIEDEVKEIKIRGKEQYMALENRVKEALVNERQAQIDTYTQINEAINNARSDMLDAMREQIEETRQIRNNTDKEREIEEKRQRLAYLQRDTSGANKVEILSLQEEINKDEVTYGDTLIDQSLQKLQTDNEKAAEKRQEQIDIMNLQLTSWQESGLIWDTVRQEMETFFDGGDSMIELLRDTENWQSLSLLQKQRFEEELTENGKLAKLFNDGTLAESAEATQRAVEAYSNELHQTLSTGVLGNMTLDEGNNLNVTLHDYNPKYSEDTARGISNINSKLGGIWDLLKEELVKLRPTSTGTNNQRANYITQIEYDFQMSAMSGNSSFNANSLRDYLGVDFHSLSDDQLIQLSVWLAEIKKDIGTKANQSKIRGAIGLTKYKTGGLNTETGPAWLDGTPGKPEAVLDAEETRALYTIVDNSIALRENQKNGVSGDNYYNIKIDVDEIASDYDVEQVADKIKRMIVEDSQYRNVNFVEALI